MKHQLIKEHKINSLAEVIEGAAKRYGNRSAYSIVLPNGSNATLNYTEVNEHSNNLAVYLKEALKLKSHDVVAIMCPNTLSYPVAAFGVLKAGLILTNVNPLYTDSELIHQLKDSHAKVLIIIDLFGDKVERVVKQTHVEHVIHVSLADFMPFIQQRLLRFALKHLKKQIPPLNFESVAIDKALHRGASIRRKYSIDTRSYRSDVSPEDTAIYQYTGGTTGVSKGAELTHQSLDYGTAMINTVLRTELDSEIAETILLVLPMYHAYAFTVGTLLSPQNGFHSVLCPSPRPISNLKPAFDKYDISFLPGINTLYQALLAEEWFVRNPPKHLKISTGGGSATLVSTAEKWLELTGIKIVEAYGMTEALPITIGPVDGNHQIGSIGYPVGGIEVRLVDDEGNDVADGSAGEVIVRGPQVMKGYLNRPKATAETIVDGWLHTGDIAVKQNDGFYKIVDRKKEMIIVSGFNVYPSEIEALINQIDGITECACIGVPDSKTGEAIKIVLAKDKPTVDEKTVIEFSRKHLTGYKIPKYVEFMDELPKSPVGKILKKELR